MYFCWTRAQDSRAATRLIDTKIRHQSRSHDRNACLLRLGCKVAGLIGEQSRVLTILSSKARMRNVSVSVCAAFHLVWTAERDPHTNLVWIALSDPHQRPQLDMRGNCCSLILVWTADSNPGTKLVWIALSDPHHSPNSPCGVMTAASTQCGLLTAIHTKFVCGLRSAIHTKGKHTNSCTNAAPLSIDYASTMRPSEIELCSKHLILHMHWTIV